MTNRDSPTRRGVAFLIVLATLIVVVTASATLASVASTIKMRRLLDNAASIADDLLPATETPILTWLEAESSQVVLPPDVTTPRVEILHDAWHVGELVCRLDISGWDQCGMVPIPYARAGSPLRMALPEVVRASVDRVQIDRDQQPGLDLFPMKLKSADKLEVFPHPLSSDPLVFADDFSPWDADSAGWSPGVLPSSPISPAIGALLSTHTVNRINVNTAPRKVVEQALRAAGRGGIEFILATRGEGRAVSLGDLPGGSDPNRAALWITGTSTAWAFRIDIRVGTLRRSWWAVYVRSRSSWECVQRLAITE